MRVGIGYDLHRLVEGRPLILGGVKIPHNKGLSGHSDADALAHAVIDALLGAAGLGNIGRMFPDDDPRYKDADSMELLARAASKVGESGYDVVNIDANIIAQAPKLNPYLDKMAQKIAKNLKIAPENVSVKAKTNEGLGPEGREEAISAQAVAMLHRGHP